MTAAREDVEPELTREQHSALFGELCDLWRVVYGCDIGCFCGSSGELIEAVQDLRGRAAAIQDRERE